MITFNIKIDNLVLKSEEEDPYKMAQIFFVWDNGDETSIVSFDYIEGGDYSITIDLPDYISTLSNFSKDNFKKLVGMIVVMTNKFLLRDDEKLSILSVDDQDFGEVRDFEENDMTPEEWYDSKNAKDKDFQREYEEEYGDYYYEDYKEGYNEEEDDIEPDSDKD